MIEALLLDVMDTLVWDPYRLLPEVFGLTWPELSDALDPEAWVSFERGLIDEEEYLRCFFADRRAYDHRALVSAMMEGYRWIEGIEALLADLQASGVAMHALSNYPSWYEHIEQRLDLSRYLQWSFVSCKTGLRKPSPEAFSYAAESLGVPRERCLFVDDRQRNCDAARATGMPALRFTTAPALRDDLTARGLLHP